MNLVRQIGSPARGNHRELVWAQLVRVRVRARARARARARVRVTFRVRGVLSSDPIRVVRGASRRQVVLSGSGLG